MSQADISLPFCANLSSPVSLNLLLHGSIGFAWGVRIMAFISLACLIVGICLMTSPGHVASPSPSIEELQEVSVSKEEEEPPKPKLFEWSFILICCHLFFVSLGTQFPLYYIQLYAERHGVSQELAFYSIAITNIAGLFGRLIPNHLADRYGCLDVYLPCITLNGDHFVSSIGASSSWYVLLLKGILGFAMLGAGTPTGLVCFCVTWVKYSRGWHFDDIHLFRILATASFLVLVSMSSALRPNTDDVNFPLGVSLYLPLVASLSPKGADLGSVNSNQKQIPFLLTGIEQKTLWHCDSSCWSGIIYRATHFRCDIGIRLLLVERHCICIGQFRHTLVLVELFHILHSDWH